MDFLIADTFTDSLARLTGDEQKAAKTTAFDLQINPAHPGLNFHKLNGRDKNFWSVRVSADIRLIVHRTEGSLLLCYVDHHDKAYAWAERRKLEIHPKTGAAQMVEVRETVKEVVVPKFVEQVTAAPSPGVTKGVVSKQPFLTITDNELLSYGVPVEWLADVHAATEETLYIMVKSLPAEAAEALLELATGGIPRIPESTSGNDNPFDHPDAKRRFRTMANVDELQQALDAPWDKWTIFLHPEQRQWVEHDYNGPARVAGSAGTGKTIVALHRAAHLAKTHPGARVLLTTFSDPLANALQTKLRRLVGEKPRLADRIDVQSLDAVGLRLHKALFGPALIIAPPALRDCLDKARKSIQGHNFTLPFIVAEWSQVVDAWQLTNWEKYRDVARLGRKTRLAETQRRLIWSIMEATQTDIRTQGLMTRDGLFTRLAEAIRVGEVPPYEFVIVDEAQDLSVSQLRFLAAMGAGRIDALFFAGDLGQRIFQTPFSWKSLGVDVRGRSKTLRVNYRTSHQIRSQADRLLEIEVSDVDGNKEDRGNTVSVFNGPSPLIKIFSSEDAESTAVAEWIKVRVSENVEPHEIAVFVRSDAQMSRAESALINTGLPYRVLDEHLVTSHGKISLCTMHLAKGLEFRAVVVMACDDEVIPLQERISAVGDEGDLQETYITERQLLYVACTRARDHLLISATDPASEFLEDLVRG